MIMKWIEARGQELSTKIGTVLGAVGAAAALADKLGPPWSYIAFGGALLMVIIPERK